MTPTAEGLRWSSMPRWPDQVPLPAAASYLAGLRPHVIAWLRGQP
jgi:hypothetical protein